MPAAARGNIVWTSGCTEADALAVLGAAGCMRERSSCRRSSTPRSAPRAARSAKRGRPVIEVAPARRRARSRGGRRGCCGSRHRRDRDGAERDRHRAAVAAIAGAIRRRVPDCHIHVDAAQAFGKVPLDVTALGADSVALAATSSTSEGRGRAWLRAGAVLERCGSAAAEKGLRGGTQDAPGAAASDSPPSARSRRCRRRVRAGSSSRIA